MNQSGFIAACLLAAFVLYVAAKGRLVEYTAVLWGDTAAPLPTFVGIPLLSVGASAPASGLGEAAKPSVSAPDIATIGSDAMTALEFLP